MTQLRDLYTSMSTDFKEDFEKRISLVIKDQDQFGNFKQSIKHDGGLLVLNVCSIFFRA